MSGIITVFYGLSQNEPEYRFETGCKSLLNWVLLVFPAWRDSLLTITSLNISREMIV